MCTSVRLYETFKTFFRYHNDRQPDDEWWVLLEMGHFKSLSNLSSKCKHASLATNWTRLLTRSSNPNRDSLPLDDWKMTLTIIHKNNHHQDLPFHLIYWFSINRFAIHERICSFCSNSQSLGNVALYISKNLVLDIEGDDCSSVLMLGLCHNPF